MSSDGASLGVKPERALGTIIGGKDQPDDSEKMSPAEFTQWIRSAPTLADYLETRGSFSYDETSRVMAATIVLYWEATGDEGPDDTQFATKDGQIDFFTPVVPGLYERMKTYGLPLNEMDLTGFMWGWALNAAKTVKGIQPGGNPALLEIG